MIDPKKNGPKMGRFIPLSLFLVAATGCATQDVAGENDNTVSMFSSEKSLLNDTNTSYGQRASLAFPPDPVNYFARVKLARDMMRAGDCAGALFFLEQVTEEYADNGNVWGLLGVCREQAGMWETAAEAYVRALHLGVQPWDLDLDLNPNDIMVKIAGLYAQAGDADEALIWLKRGLEARYDERPDIAQMPEFASLTEIGDFAALAGLAPEGNRTRDEEWLYDIAFLKDQVVMLHGNADHLTSAATLERMLVGLSAAVPSLSDEQITARIDLFIGALGAGHDLFWPVNAEHGAMLPFALKVYLFTDGLYIIDAYDPDLIGSRIDKLGETPTDVAYEIIADAFPGDNDMETRWMAPRHLTQAYTLEALSIVDDAATATLTITDSRGVQRTIAPERRPFTPLSPALMAPPDVSVPLYLSRLDENYWTHYIDELDALYVQFNLAANAEDESLAEFADRVSEEIAGRSTRNLVLDLRNSPGGNGYLTPPLLRNLIHFAASPESDNLYVIISRNTFSASQNLITDLDRMVEPIFVGEPSGSRPNALSESGNFVLPFSRLSGLLSSQLHQQSWPEDHRIWIAPDVPVGLSSSDFFSGRDPALEAIAVLIADQ